MENSSTDEKLMTAVRDHDCPESFSALVDRWHRPVFSLCVRMISSQTDAEDMAQDVFSNLYRKRDSYQIAAKFSTYLWQIAINRCRDFMRQRQRMSRRQDEYEQIYQPKEFDPCAEIEARDQVAFALKQLPENYREVIVLKHFQGLSFKQIAQVVEVPIGTAASRMSKGMELLKEVLEKGLK